METEDNKLKLYLTIIISMMTISLPILYLIGFFYDLGYLSVFGLNEQFFPREVSDYLVSSFIVFFKLIFSILTIANEHYYFFIILAVIIFLFSILIVHLAKNEKSLNIKKEKIINYKYFDYLALPIFLSAFGLGIPYLFISLLAILVAIPAGSYIQGKNDSTESIEKFKGCEKEFLLSTQSCVFISKDETVISMGMFIAKSTTHIAIWNGNSTEIHPVKDDKIEILFGIKEPAQNNSK